MALRKFGDQTPQHADAPIDGSETVDANNLTPEQQAAFTQIKDEILAGKMPENVPEEFKQKLEGIMAVLGPMTSVALDVAVGDLLKQARAAQREERETGSPGPVFRKFMEAIVFYFQIESKSRLEVMLAARFVTLLAAAYEELGAGFELDIQNPKYTWQ